MRLLVRILAAAAALAPGVATAPAAAERPTIVFLSAEEFAAGAHGQPQLRHSVAAGCQGDIPGGWWAIKWEERDLRGVDIPIRKGDNLLGYAHYATRHNLCTREPVAAAFRTRTPARDLGARQEYVTYAVQQPGRHVRVTIRVIVQAASRAENAGYIAGDGRNIGVITAYCENVPQDRCPDWVDRPLQ